MHKKKTFCGAVPACASLIVWFIACSPQATYSTAEQHEEVAADAQPMSGDAMAGSNVNLAGIDLDGINLDNVECDCAAAALKNLNSKLHEAEALLDTAKNSLSETQLFLDDFNAQIVAERKALNEDIASDIEVYKGIVVDSLALALDVSVPGSALVRRAACVAGKQLTNKMVQRTLTTVAKRTTFDNPLKSGLRRVGVSRVIQANNNGPVELMTWIPVIGPAAEIAQKWQALQNRDAFIQARKDNLVFLVSEYDRYNAMLQDRLADVERLKAEVADWQSKILSFNSSQALCEMFSGDDEVLGAYGIDPNWPAGWSDVFFVKNQPKPVKCESAWIQFTGSSRLSRLWGSRDAVNAAKAQAEQMCLNTFGTQIPNPTCDAGYSQFRTAFFDQPDGAQNPSGDRHGAGCGAPRFYGSSTAWSDPLTEIDCKCFRTTCCGEGANMGSGAMPVAN